MLIKKAVLDGIASGDIDLLFRTWDAERVHAGSTQRTAIGVLAVDAVEETDPAELTEEDARRGGYASLDALRHDAETRDGTLYRITLHLAGEDPRIALRAEIPRGRELTALRDRVLHMGDWAVPTLEMIAAQPGVRAPDLAAQAGREKRPFKASVRRLKELGLTESLAVGYRLSPRGKAVLSAVRRATASA
ncbi:hypothetical protein LZ495_03030 [Yinghuangia sp. KLBMP8922]|uniref:ASCH domain-containing protein n=1 Tax=Yinghuangia soli TaxID=2908204 RepID=A0AA41PX84_9ACTN|nr:hypothetical protein [Yinghuangia soli]